MAHEVRILLVRHGLTDMTGPVLAGRTPGVHLNDAGRAQAERLAERLEGVPLGRIVSSPLERCRETAAPVARSHGLRTRTDRRLLEVEYGQWTGRPLPELAKTKLWSVVQHRPSLAEFPDGESLLESGTRIVSLIESMRRTAEGNVLCVSHADMIKLAVAHYAGMHMDQYQRIVIAPASVSSLRFGTFGCQVERLNDCGALDDLIPPGRSDKRRQNRSSAAREWGHA